MSTRSLEELLTEARSGLPRIQPSELAAALARGALVVDHRDSADIEAEGSIPGSIQIRRSVLEWRLAPSSPWRSHNLTSNSEVILLCNEGFSSSLAAATLQSLGLERCTDLEGGYRSWRTWSEAQPSSIDC